MAVEHFDRRQSSFVMRLAMAWALVFLSFSAHALLDCKTVLEANPFSSDHYVRLGLDRKKGASKAEVRAAFSRLALKFHPNQHAENDRVQTAYRNLVEAYAQLREGFAGIAEKPVTPPRPPVGDDVPAGTRGQAKAKPTNPNWQAARAQFFRDARNAQFRIERELAEMSRLEETYVRDWMPPVEAILRTIEDVLISKNRDAEAALARFIENRAPYFENMKPTAEETAAFANYRATFRR